MDAVENLNVEGVGVVQACHALSLSRATFYRHRRDGRMLGPNRPRPTPRRALSEEERQEVLDVLYSEDFVDKSPAAVWACLLEQGRYLCSPRTMYRILASQGAAGERRPQRTHPSHNAPDLVATAPKQVWSWDITKLKGAYKGQWFYLYVIMDIFSRYVVGWMVATSETAELAKRLIGESALKQGIDEDHLTLHSDRGTAMTSKKVSRLLEDLGIAKSFSRPRVSDDNPYSEAHFKTIKYHPAFPENFQSVEDVRFHIGPLMHWYNNEHHHEGIALLTPATVHHGWAEEITLQRQEALDTAYKGHPERFVNGAPKALQLPKEVRIGRPATTLTTGVILP